MSAGVPNQADISLLASTSTTAHATSPTEVVHIAFAFVVLTADLVIILSGRGLLEGGTLAGLLTRSRSSMPSSRLPPGSLGLSRTR